MFSIGSEIDAPTVSRGSSDPCGSWKTAWIRCVRRTGLDRSAGSSPATRTVPRVGRTSPRTARASVVFPEPEFADDGERLAGAHLQVHPADGDQALATPDQAAFATDGELDPEVADVHEGRAGLRTRRRSLARRRRGGRELDRRLLRKRPIRADEAGDPAAATDVDQRRHVGLGALGPDRAAGRVGAPGRQARDVDGLPGYRLEAPAGRGRPWRDTQQRARVGMARAPEDLVDRRVFHDPAAIHHDDPAAHLADDAQVVRDEQKPEPPPGVRPIALAGIAVLAGTATADPAEEVEDLGLDRHVERGRRLVRDQQARLVRDRERDQAALAHAAAQLVRVAAGLGPGLRQFGLPQRRQDAAGDRRAGHAVGAEALGEVIAERPQRVERGHRVLEDHAGLGAAERSKLARREGHQVDAVEGDPTAQHGGCGRQQLHQRQRQGALPRARFAHHADPFAGCHRERHVVYRERVAPCLGIADRQARDLEQRCGGPRRGSGNLGRRQPPVRRRHVRSARVRPPAPSLTPSASPVRLMPATVMYRINAGARATSGAV